jgi:hypothetical protein
MNTELLHHLLTVQSATSSERNKNCEQYFILLLFEVTRTAVGCLIIDTSILLGIHEVNVKGGRCLLALHDVTITCMTHWTARVRNLGVCILLCVLDQVQGFPSNATLF